MSKSLVVFVQAEDGIRDLVRSRGLGDVYKRQIPDAGVDAGRERRLGHYRDRGHRGRFPARSPFESVSYTHLTLPTSDLA